MDAEVRLTRSELVGLAIVVVVIVRLTIAHHCHHVREGVLIVGKELRCISTCAK